MKIITIKMRLCIYSILFFLFGTIYISAQCTIYTVKPVITSSITVTGVITSGNATQLVDGEGAGGTGAGPYPNWYTNVPNLPIVFNMDMQSASTIDHIKLYLPWGNTEWIKDFSVKLYNTANVLLGTENLTAPDQYATNNTILSFSQEYTNVSHIEFTIFNGQGYNTVVTPQRASVNEIVFLDMQKLCPENVLWYRADKGVNTFTGIPATDNTQLTTWYDQAIINGSQDGGLASPHPGSPEETNLPAMPYYRYANGFNFNFNPVISFDGTNAGQAVQFDTPAKRNQTVFAVFKSQGQSSTFYYSGLLYGGDVLLVNPTDGDGISKSDISLGISNQSRIELGGGSDGDFDLRGDIQLNNMPAIGTFKRNRVSNEEVYLSMYASGSTEISNQNADPTNTKIGEGRDLISQLRIGKAFSAYENGLSSSFGKLTGSVAEVIVYDDVLSEADRAKVESYLAIKYGITLTGGTQQFGAVVGNNNYDYVNSSGIIIRASDAVYKYDVFGLGRDDAYELNQRISKSNNAGDILIASTNSDFTNMNLYASRTAINGDREFMLFANNKGSGDAVNTQTTELPVGIASRLDREWKVSHFNTDGSNIPNISLKFDLSGFTFSGADAGSIRLLVDTDGDGDFTTGTIIKIPANSFVAGTSVQFDNLNFSDGQVFTLGLLAPFTCDSSMYLAQTPNAATNTTLYGIDTSSNPFIYPPIGSIAALKYNAMGFNPLDGFIYAMADSSNNILRIHPDGTYTNLGAVTNLPAGNYNSGEIDHLGNFYITAIGPTSTMYRINITTKTATAITLSGSVPIDPSDLAYNMNNGLLYGVNNGGRLISINPSNGTVSLIGAAGPGVPFGAMMGSSTGEVFGVSNNGGFYQFNITNGTRVKISDSPISTGNDGAHCVTAPITFEADLAVTKTNENNVYQAGTNTIYTIVVTNNGPFGVLNASVVDNLPTGIPATNATYTAVASSGSLTNVVGTQTGAINDLISLPVGGIVTYTVTLSIPSEFSGILTNTVTVTPPSNIDDPDSNNNTATDTDTPGDCPSYPYSAVLVANTNQGKLIEYNTVTNSINTLCSGITLTDGGIVGDIAMDSSGTIWGITSTRKLIKINPSTCAVTEVVADLGFSGNGLSFMPDGNLLVGGGDSTVVRKIDIVGGTYTTSIWHDFMTGFSNGDFIFINNKVYVLWFDPGIDSTNPILIEVTVDSNFNYISQTILGTLPPYTWGLAKVNGSQLYGVTGIGNSGSPNPEGSIIKINLSPTFSWTTVSSYTEQFYGATSIEESALECNDVCYKPGIITGTSLSTNVGITAINRAGTNNSDNWPMTRKGGWLALESKTKGFVPNRTAFDTSGNPVGILSTNFVEGMMVYDTTNKCMKIYTTKEGDPSPAWHCITTQSCPD